MKQYVLVGIVAFAIFGGLARVFAGADVISAGEEGVLLSSQAARFQLTFGTAAGIEGVNESEQAGHPISAGFAEAGLTGIREATAAADQNVFATADYTATLELLGQMENILDINIRQVILDAPDRMERYQEIEQSLNGLLETARAKLTDFSVEKTLLQQEIDTLEKDAKNDEGQFFTAMENFDAESADRLYELFVDKNRQSVTKRARLGIVKSLDERVLRIGQDIKTRLAAVRNNREALIAGVKVDPHTARLLGLLKADDELEASSEE